MNNIKSFKLFEGLSQKENLMGKILHLYGSIPVPKEKSSVVIGKIIYTSGQAYNVTDDIDLTHAKAHDKIRFIDYFDSLINSKDSRGHNFEGFVAGVFNGQLNPRGAKADVNINGVGYSVKFIDNPSKAPELGSYRVNLVGSYLEKYIDKYHGLTNLFKLANNTIIERNLTAIDLKENICDAIFRDVDSWIVAYPNLKENPTKIIYQTFDKSILVDMLCQGKVAAPKGGLKSKYTLALSARFKDFKGVTKNFISIPVVTLRELENILPTNTEQDWGVKVFGPVSYKMRPDVLRYIKGNSSQIIKRLIDMEKDLTKDSSNPEY